MFGSEAGDGDGEVNPPTWLKHLTWFLSVVIEFVFFSGIVGHCILPSTCKWTKLMYLLLPSFRWGCLSCARAFVRSAHVCMPCARGYRLECQFRALADIRYVSRGSSSHSMHWGAINCTRPQDIPPLSNQTASILALVLSCSFLFPSLLICKKASTPYPSRLCTSSLPAQYSA